MVPVCGIALEVNTSGIGTAYNRYFSDEPVLERYRKLGGYLITVGSDSHAAGRVGNGFRELKTVLKKLGFRNAYYYKKRIPVQYSLDDPDGI